MGEFCDIRVTSSSRRTFLSRGAAAGGAVVLGAGAAIVLAGCSSGSSTTPTTVIDGGSSPAWAPARRSGAAALTIGTIAEIDGFYPPTNHWDTNGFLYANAVYDPLMAVAADGTIQPYLAESMTSNSDLRRLDHDAAAGHQVQRRIGAHLGGGQGQLRRAAASALTGTALKQIASVTTPDAMTVVYTLTGPNPTFPVRPHHPGRLRGRARP